jgi:hypothetical protein
MDLGSSFKFKVFSKYPRVEMLGKHILVISDTSVPSECWFSYPGLINTYIRNYKDHVLIL